MKKGFTLVEMTLYVGLTSVIMISLLRAMTTMMEHNTVTSSRETVQQELRIAMEQMLFTIREALSVQSAVSVFDNSAGTLALSLSGSGRHPTTFRLYNDAIQVQKGSGAWSDITSTNIVVNQLLFERKTGANTAASIGITITGTDIFDSSGPFIQKSITLRDVATIRRQFAIADPRELYGTDYYESSEPNILYDFSSSGPACTPTESPNELTCSDASDNDCDGNVDCADANCEGLTCATGTCSGGSCIADMCSKIYWTYYDSADYGIRRSEMDGSNVETLLSSSTMQSFNIELDDTNTKMYWGDTQGNIMRSPLDVSPVAELIYSEPGMIVSDIALDIPSTMLYWLDQTSFTVRRIQFDGSGEETLVSSLGLPKGIDLDLITSEMYFGDCVPAAACTIKKAPMSGGSPTVVFDLAAQGEEIGTGLELVTIDGTQYVYMTTSDGYVARVQTNGTNFKKFTDGAVGGNYAIDVDSSTAKYHWAKTEGIREAMIDGTNAQDTFLRPAGEDVYGLAVCPSGATPPPVIASLSPDDDATDISVTANLVITFTTAVDPEAGANDIAIYESGVGLIETIDAQDAKVTGGGTSTITINPATVLNYDTEYYVQIGVDAFDDASSNSFTGINDTTSWSFTTEVAGCITNGNSCSGPLDVCCSAYCDPMGPDLCATCTVPTTGQMCTKDSHCCFGETCITGFCM